MKYVKRDSMFETNSSSTHALTISKRGEPETPCRLDGDLWELTEPEEKALMAYQFALGMKEQPFFDDEEEARIIALLQALKDEFFARIKIQRQEVWDELCDGNALAACEHVFSRGQIPDCWCCHDMWEDIQTEIGQRLETMQDVKPFVDKLLDENVYFECEEEDLHGD